MATQVAKQRSIQKWLIYLVTGLSVLVWIGLCLVGFITVVVFEASFGPVVDDCFIISDEEQPSTKRSLLGARLLLAAGLTGLVIGMIFDVAMFQFLKNRKKHVQPIPLVSWQGNHVHWSKLRLELLPCLIF